MLAVAPDPFGVNGALRTALGLLRERCDSAVTNTENCRKLLETAEWSRTCLQGAPEAAWAEVEEEKHKLEAALNKACEFLKSFGSGNFWDRLVGGSRAGPEGARKAREHATSGGTALVRIPSLQASGPVRCSPHKKTARMPLRVDTSLLFVVP